MTVNDTKALATHFRNDPKFGRTTTLVVKATGEVLSILMGVSTRAQMWSQYKWEKHLNTLAAK